jgi:hypothetical protein
MTLKSPLRWRYNTLKNISVPQYSSTSVQYSSTTTSYSSPTNNLSNTGVQPARWQPQVKQPTIWQGNPAAETNRYAYDTTALYDSSTRTYDGIVADQDSYSASNPTKWQEA